MHEAAPFQVFGPQHLVTLGLLLLLAALICLAGRRWPSARCKSLGILLALALLGYTFVVYIQKGLAHELSWSNALPLELCHWVMIACVISLFRRQQILSEIAYFWGFAGTLQATLTPEISQGFPSLEFIFFFWSHGAILLAIVYFIACQGFRPRPGSVTRMLAAISVYALIVGGLNACFGWNYGYLCSRPAQASLLDYLGPWPWYLVSLELIAVASFWLLNLPWQLLGRPGGPEEKGTAG